MKKVLIVTDAWSPQVNGVVTVVEKTVALLKEKGYEVDIIHPGLFRTIPVFFYPEIRLSLFSRNTIRRRIDSFKPDAIHIVTEGTLGLAARSICKRRGLRFTTSYHTHFPQYLKIRTKILFTLVYKYVAWFHNAGVVTMVATESLRDELAQHGFRKLALWPLGVDTDLFVRNPNAQSMNLHKPVFVYFGRIAIEKGVEEYLRCNLPGTKLVIGDGPQRKELQSRYKGNAVFVGYKKGKDLVDALSECDVFVFPSRTDTFGLVVVEALACGVPVAAHNVMGPKDIITDGVDGVLSEDLQKAALACLELSREKCREKALAFSWQHSVDAFMRTLVPVR